MTNVLVNTLGTNDEPVDVLTDLGWENAPTCDLEAKTVVDGKATIQPHYSR